MNENGTNEGTFSFLNNEDNSFNLQLSLRLSFKSFSTVFEPTTLRLRGKAKGPRGPLICAPSCKAHAVVKSL